MVSEFNPRPPERRQPPRRCYVPNQLNVDDARPALGATGCLESIDGFQASVNFAARESG